MSHRSYLRDAPPTGMNLVLAGAAARGFTAGDPEWINLGQGQPEIGDLPDAPPRITRIGLEPGDHAYGPVNGARALRTAVAEHYNRLYREGRSSRYTADNVAIVAGGRPGLHRAVAALGDIDMGYLLPDYAAYEEILDHHAPRIRPVAVDATPGDARLRDRVAPGDAGPGDRVARIADAVTRSGLAAVLMSNPRNPTGEVLAGDELGNLLRRLRDATCALLVDEFYSHYIYAPDGTGGWGPADGPVSAAAYVDDVDADDVLIFDGLTKNFRYPGWRLGWVIGPAETIGVIERVGQAMDGGASQVVQRAALAALEPSYAQRETSAVRAAFARKRSLTVAALREMGIRLDAEPRGTFYAWGCLADLPESLRHADDFFAAALEHRVITVPGHVFDLDPGTRRATTGAFDDRIRFSYGPTYDAVATGLDRLRVMVDKAR